MSSRPFIAGIGNLKPAHACCRKIRNAASNRISLSIQSKLSLLALVCLRI
ncbi:Uncharacterised protein [Vibrio cholerae]|nr:Uncharacterised protein [Vibrio cholerae]